MGRWGWGGFRPYVPVAKRRADAAKAMARLVKKGESIQPVVIEGRAIARSFWGQAWCQHLEKFSDYANRLPRGRTYVRNGSVCHLDLGRGLVNAKVGGSSLYTVTIKVAALPAKKWAEVKARCAGHIGSILELLQGRLSDSAMAVVTDRDHGLFPLPGEIELKCSCPDWADMCKHVAAVLYGVGARLDTQPELLFTLRGVAADELVSGEQAAAALTRGKTDARKLDESDLSEVFGIDLQECAPAPAVPPRKKVRRGDQVKRRATPPPPVAAPAESIRRVTPKKAVAAPAKLAGHRVRKARRAASDG